MNQQADFALTLASRVPPETSQENAAAIPRPARRRTVRRNTGGGAQNLALLAALAGADGCRCQQRRYRSRPTLASQ